MIFLLSGGASALLPLPADGIRLEEKQEVTQLLLDCGADIKEINTIRKHISQIKGGRIAQLAYPSTVLGLILSDVVGDPLDAIGSGPTVPDTSTFQEAWEILRKYDLLKEIAPSIQNHLRLGKEGKIEETPKPGHPAFEKVHNILIGSNLLALRAVAEESSLSASIHSFSPPPSWAKQGRRPGSMPPSPVRSLITGIPFQTGLPHLRWGNDGDDRGNGKGGRNQEFALAGAMEIGELEKVVLLSGGTDGTDGPTDAAGAIADTMTIKRAREMGLGPKAHLENNDAYPFLRDWGTC